MNDDKIQAIVDEMLGEIDKEEETEKHIVESAEEIASYLLMNESNKAKAEVDGKVFVFGYRVISDKKIFMLVANETKQKIAQDKYRPFTVTAEIEKEYTMKQNLIAMVEGFIRHITGKFKAEELGS